MKKLRPSAIFMLLATSHTSWAQPNKGCVAIYHEGTPISIEVNLPDFSGGVLRTSQFQFTNMPANMLPDENGRYCYPMSDPRFAYVHTFYYAVKEIEDYNQIFDKLGIPLRKTLAWHVLKNPEHPSTGTATGGVTYPDIAPDPTLIQHEIGHWVQANALEGNDCGDCNSDSLSEGSANLLAALHSGDSIIGRHDGEAFAYDINLFIRFPDYIITNRHMLEKIAQDAKTEKKYPSEVKSIKDALETAKNNPDLDAWLNSENPYTTSDAINQPLWLGAIKYGAETIKLVYIKSIAMINENRKYSYSEVAKIIIKNAQTINPELSLYLMREYTMRGVLTTTLSMRSIDGVRLNPVMKDKYFFERTISQA